MSTQPPVPAEDDLPEQLRIRREKRAHLIERGVDPYPVAVARTHTLKESCCQGPACDVYHKCLVSG